jgi:RNA recognition motif-containing protein
MALFVGRVASGARRRDLEDAFSRFGKMIRCDVKEEKGTLGGKTILGSLR